MTDEELRSIRERCDRAMPGPWVDDVPKLLAEVERLRNAIREHQAQRGDDRCWLDDRRLYEAAGLGLAATALPPRCEFLASCERYWEQRQRPEEKTAAGGMTIAQLEAEVERLRAALRTVWPALVSTERYELAKMVERALGEELS